MPVNTPTGAHAHGYADVSFLIPELVSGVQFKKGPYFADEGDFSAAGAANINYVNQLDHPLFELSGGNDGWGRVSSARRRRASAAAICSAAIELNHNDGPWVRPDDYQKVNGVLRFSRGDNRNGLFGDRHGLLGRLGFDRPGRAARDHERADFALRLPRSHRRWQGQSAEPCVPNSSDRPGRRRFARRGFLLRNSLNLFSNFTYFLDDPEHGDQFEQAERRVAAGGRVTYRRLGHFFDRHTESAIGVQVRRDWLDPGRPVSHARPRSGSRRRGRIEVGQTMVGVYAQTEIEWTRIAAHDGRRARRRVPVLRRPPTIR